MGYKSWPTLERCIDPAAWSYSKELNPKPQKSTQGPKNATQNPNQSQKMCTTWNTFKKDGCSYEHSNPGESCIYLHACSTCRQKGLGIKRHKAHQCPEGKGSGSSGPSVPPGSVPAAPVVTSV